MSKQIVLIGQLDKEDGGYMGEFVLIPPDYLPLVDSAETNQLINDWLATQGNLLDALIAEHAEDAIRENVDVSSVNLGDIYDARIEFHLGWLEVTFQYRDDDDYHNLGFSLTIEHMSTIKVT